MIAELILTPTQLAYREYLKSNHWRGLRLEAFKRWGRKCYKCPKTFGLDVHHLKYRSPWTACTVEDVRPCCRGCHEQEHGLVKVVSAVEKLATQRLGKKHLKLQALKQSIGAGQRPSQRAHRFLITLLRSGIKERRETAAELLAQVRSKWPGNIKIKRRRPQPKPKWMSSVFVYSKPYSKRRKWSNRDRSSN